MRKYFDVTIRVRVDYDDEEALREALYSVKDDAGSTGVWSSGGWSWERCKSVGVDVDERIPYTPTKVPLFGSRL